MDRRTDEQTDRGERKRKGKRERGRDLREEENEKQGASKTLKCTQIKNYEL